MSAVATAIIGGAVIGGAASIYGADKQANAANNAAQLQEQQYEQTRSDEAPWRTAGSTALSSIGDLMGTSGNTGAANYGLLNHQFNADDLNSSLAPNYQFQLQQGLGATQNAGNAAGFSGNTLKGINDYAQGYAGNAYQQAFSNYTASQTNMYNRLSNLAGLGQAANQVTGTQGTLAAENAGNFATSGAAASAAGTVGAANAIGNGLGNYAGWNYLNPSSSSGSMYTNTGSGGGIGLSNYNYDENTGAAINSAGDYSDERLKTNIERVGKTDSGLPIYTYDMKGGGPTKMGVMAQEVEQVAPQVVSSDPQGLKKVDYSKIGDIHKYAMGGPVGWGGPQTMRSAPGFGYTAPTSVDGMRQGVQPAPYQPTQPYQPPPQPSIGGYGSNQISNFGQPNLLPAMPGRSSLMPVRQFGMQAMAGGGPVVGPGGPKSDQVPAMLSNGEHIFDTASVNAMGDGDNELGQKRLTYLRDMLKYGRKQ